MNIVIGATTMFGPLTGVGHYTLQLTRALMQQEDIESLQLLVHGRLRPASAALPVIQQFEAPAGVISPAHKASWTYNYRRLLAKNASLATLYASTMQIVAASSLRRLDRNTLFHATDFRLPRFKGRKVASILDLSTLNMPQCHPPARVRAINRQIQHAIQHADHIITLTDFVKHEIQGRFDVPDERITTIYLAADETYRPVSEAEFSACVTGSRLQYKRYLLALGTIEPRKNLRRLLDAYELYYSRHGSSSLPLVVAGYRGWQSDDIHRRLRQLEERGLIYYLGYVPQSELPTLVAGACALVFPSLYEGFGLPVIEAFQAGTPVITSANTAMAEIARGAALLAAADDHEQLAQRMYELSSNPTLAAQLSNRGREVSRQYSWSRCVAATMQLYRSLC